MADPVQQLAAAMARAAAAAPAFDPYALVRERLAQLLASSDGGMDGAALAEAYQRAFRAQLAQVAQNLGAKNLRELLLTQASALGIAAEKTGGGSAGNVWVTLPGQRAGGTNGAEASVPRATPPPAGPPKPQVSARQPPAAPEAPPALAEGDNPDGL